MKDLKGSTQLQLSWNPKKLLLKDKAELSSPLYQLEASLREHLQIGLRIK